MIELRLAMLGDLRSLNTISGKGSSYFHLFRLNYQRINLGDYIIGFYDKFPAGHLFVNYSDKKSYDFMNSPLIQDFFVKEDFRQKGLGRKLIEFSLDTISKKGHSCVGLEVEKSNFVAKKFYEKLGFLPKIEYGELFSKNVNFFIYMEKELE